MAPQVEAADGAEAPLKAAEPVLVSAAGKPKENADTSAEEPVENPETSAEEPVENPDTSGVERSSPPTG